MFQILLRYILFGLLNLKKEITVHLAFWGFYRLHYIMVQIGHWDFFVKILSEPKHSLIFYS